MQIICKALNINYVDVIKEAENEVGKIVNDLYEIIGT